MQYFVRIMIINPNRKSEYVMVKAVKSPTGANDFGVVKQLILDSFPANQILTSFSLDMLSLITD